MYIRLLIANIACLAVVFARTENTIGQCPDLRPREGPPANVRDLRPDDIKVISAMGDSFMAAFGAKGIQGSILNVSSLYEYRGVSFAAGGDGNVSTVPNFIKRYNPRLLGASVGEHLVEYCEGNVCPSEQYRPFLDRLNVAQSGAMVQNLERQTSYLIEGLRDYPGVNFKEDWKLINVLIGTVDQCYSCISSYESSISPEVYGASIDNMLARIRKEVPRALVNLIGTYNNSQTKIIAANQKYCEPFASTDFEFNQLECWCIHYEPSRRIMDRFVTAYNEQLRKNSKKYNLYNDQDFAVMFSPSPVNILTFPIDALSNIDCLHPSTKGHEWSSRALWKNMFLPQANKATTMNWDDYQEVYCPTEGDRFQVD